jgi:hypothetical protein
MFNEPSLSGIAQEVEASIEAIMTEAGRQP